MVQTKEEIAAYDKARYLKNADKLRKQRRERYWKDPEKERAKKRAYDDDNRELINQRYKEKYHKNPEKFREKRKKYYYNNSEIEKQRHKDWVENNRDKLNEYNKIWNKLNPDKVKKWDSIKHSRRKDWGKPEPINEWFNKSALHHLHINNHKDCIYIPEELHKSIWHSYDNQDTMNKINNVVINWTNKTYNLSLFKRGF